MPKSSFTFFLVFIIGLIGGGVIIYQLVPTPKDNPLIQKRLSGNYQFINPLLECDNQSPVIFHPNLNQLKNQITSYLDQLKLANHLTGASVYFRDLNNGPWFGINEKDKFSPASLIKVPVLLAYYKAAETDNNLLTQTIKNSASLPSSPGQNILPQPSLIPDASYSISDLIEKMIVYSDNQAYALLLSHIGTAKINATLTDLGLEYVVKDNTENSLLVKDYAGLFRILFNASYLSKNYSEQALNLLSNTKFDQGLTAKLPSTLAVSHKFGERHFVNTQEKQLHDCGIVYLPNRPYLVCIMTRGQNFDDLAQSIAHISSLIYQTVSSSN
jgi:beta-lactamase class A